MKSSQESKNYESKSQEANDYGPKTRDSSTKLKLVIFDGSFKTTAFINRLIQGLVKQGVEVFVIGFNEENKQPIPGVIYQSLGSNQSKLRLMATSLELAFQSGSFSKVLSACQFILNSKRLQLQAQNLDVVLKLVKPDILHAQWPTLLVWLERYFVDPDFKIVLSQRGFQTNIKPFIDRDNYKFLKQCYLQIDGLHSVSHAISKVGKQIGIPKTKIDKVVYTGLNLDKFDFKLSKKWSKSLKLISIGRSHWKKNYPTALHACKILKDNHFNFHYTIVGASKDEETLFLVHELGLIDQVTLTGKLPQHQVFEEVQKADLMLLPSIEEGIANVVVEAMALGTPVISTDCGGMKELITHGKEGWIVPVRDPKAMANQILNFKKFNYEELKRIQLAARNKVEQQHSEKQMLDGMLRLYNSIIE